MYRHSLRVKSRNFQVLKGKIHFRKYTDKKRSKISGLIRKLLEQILV